MLENNKNLAGQDWHLALLVLLLTTLNLALRHYPVTGQDPLFGTATETWVWLGTGAAVLHHLYLVILQRVELATGWFKENAPSYAHLAFLADNLLFAMLRTGTLVMAAMAGKDAIYLPFNLRLILALAFPVAYLLLAAHGRLPKPPAPAKSLFHPEAGFAAGKSTWSGEKYLARRRFFYHLLTPLFYLPGLLTASNAALLLALFSHLYLWVHYFCTEVPDSRRPGLPGP